MFNQKEEPILILEEDHRTLQDDPTPMLQEYLALLYVEEMLVQEAQIQ
jgi:hypothetical protein